ncbi:hypothetical protein F4809DRAFT_633470 [Biscogniauxia mediterranea]|nr:hypothetical protein F4809DRAFT_633470 [Biscogniauxia mediterranea]
MTEVTRLEARYVLRSKLANLLQQLFGEDSYVKIQGDMIQVTAPRTLTEEEIRSVTLSR